MSRRAAFRIALLLLIVAAIVGIYFSPLRQHLNRNDIRSAVASVRDVWYGPPLFILAYATGCVFALPASVFVVAAGFIWGWQLGGIYAMIGGLIGAHASFFVGRFVGEGLLLRFGRMGAAVQKQVDHAGFKSLLVMRFVPGLPFAAVNYAAGVTGVKLRDFFFATVLGLAPSNFLFAYCSDALFNGTMTERDAFKWLVVVCALMLFIVVVPSLLKRYAARPAGPRSSENGPRPSALGPRVPPTED
jgi:uncharacterized membrane protein YdjX (TVP38/TMEM64 family)